MEVDGQQTDANCVPLLNLMQFCPGVVRSSPVPPQIFAERVFLATAEGTDPARKHMRHHATILVAWKKKLPSQKAPVLFSLHELISSQ